MAFFTPDLKKMHKAGFVKSVTQKHAVCRFYFYLIGGLLCGCFSGLCYGQPFGVAIKSAELVANGDHYVLSAEMSYVLSDEAKAALQSGVPLFWDVQIHIRQHRDYFWDLAVMHSTIRYRIQYHALLNMYRVRNEISGHVENFSTLTAALDLASNLHNLPLINKAALNPDNSYYAEMKIIFDREALPLPLRPKAYLSSQWYLSSDRYVWTLTK